MQLPANYRYIVDCEYETDSHCDSEGCDREGICRCSTISNIRATSISYYALAHAITKGVKLTPLQHYAVGRIVRSLKPGDFRGESEGGYYGEELGDILLDDNEKRDKINQLLGRIPKMPDATMMEAILSFEYGYLLPELKDKNWNIDRDLSIEEIHFMGGYQRLDAKVVKEYEDHFRANYRQPRTIVVLKVDNGYRLVDGRHRFTAIQNIQARTITAIVAS